jgi:hypothetical protein
VESQFDTGSAFPVLSGIANSFVSAINSAENILAAGLRRLEDEIAVLPEFGAAAFGGGRRVRQPQSEGVQLFFSSSQFIR